jgi:hypothetical protein
MVRSLIEKGASLNIVDKYGHTPLHFAVREEHYEIVKLLIEKGANLNTENKYGDTPLHKAAKSCTIAKGEQGDDLRLQRARLLKVILLLETEIQRG